MDLTKDQLRVILLGLNRLSASSDLETVDTPALIETKEKISRWLYVKERLRSTTDKNKEKRAIK